MLNYSLKNDLLIADNLLKEANKSILNINKYIELSQRENIIQESLRYEIIAEKIANNARLMPIATGSPYIQDIITDNIIQENNIIIEYLKEGWFHIKMPSLLPKKEKGNASYIRATLAPALKKFFQANKKDKIEEKSVLIFRHNYNKERPEREYRDHDNIELNVIVDLIALYVLIDDMAMKCDHYYCSSIADEDSTDIFIVPFKDFSLWFDKNK